MNQQLTLNQFNSWLETRTRIGKRLSRATIASYSQSIRLFAAWYQSEYHEELIPAMLTNYDLLAYRQWCVQVKRYSAATWNIQRAALSVLAEWLKDPELMFGVVLQAQEEPGYRWLEDEEYGRLVRRMERRIKEAATVLEYQQTIRDRALLSLMLFAGVRVSEATTLTMDDLVIKERSGKIIIRNGKGGKDRVVPLNQYARRALHEWLSYSQTAKLFGITTRQAQRVATIVGAESGIVGLSCHDLRHTFAKRTLDGKNSASGQPVQITVVQKLLGHSRTDTTIRYVQPSWNDMEAALGVTQ